MWLALGALAVLAFVVFLAFRFASAQAASQSKTDTALAEASAQRERLVTVLRSVPHGLVVLDASNDVLMANGRAAGLWGLGPSEIVGLSLSVLSGRDVFQCGEERWTLTDLLIGSGGVGPVEVLAKGIERVYEVSTAPVMRKEEPIGTIVLFRDITEVKEFEALRDNMLHMMVHDLRTPLSGVYASLMAAHSDEPDGVKKQMLGVGVRSSKRMLSMIETMVDIGRMEAGQMPLDKKRFALDEVLEEAVVQVTPLAEAKEIELDISRAEGISFYADPGLVERVLINLLGNAIKFTPRNGHVSVLTVVDGTGRLTISVEDSGPGIPEQDRERIFDRFAQAGQRQQWGSGLGLAFCKLAVEAHEGRIWVEGAAQQGSVFKFSLPAGE